MPWKESLGKTFRLAQSVIFLSKGDLKLLQSILLLSQLFLKFSPKDMVSDLREREREREKERGRDPSVASCTCPDQGLNLQPRYVP